MISFCENFSKSYTNFFKGLYKSAECCLKALKWFFPKNHKNCPASPPPDTVNEIQTNFSFGSTPQKWLFCSYILAVRLKRVAMKFKTFFFQGFIFPESEKCQGPHTMYSKYSPAMSAKQFLFCVKFANIGLACWVIIYFQSQMSISTCCINRVTS